MYKPMLPGDEPQRLKDEFRWLARTLGEARNVDVLLPKANDADMRSRLNEAREKAYDDAISALTSSRAGSHARLQRVAPVRRVLITRSNRRDPRTAGGRLCPLGTAANAKEVEEARGKRVRYASAVTLPSRPRRSKS
ncbi:CHAD domain-containing protein [Rhizobium leguminosarum]|uniref:CHAD domain-containing protein n=1 Tax=Rhizobium leguminosarum TaxID=384 RepID=UPI003D7B784B